MKEKSTLIVKNGVVTPRIGSLSKKNDATITINKSDLVKLFIGQADVKGLLESGKLKIDGNPKAYADFQSQLATFDFWFNISEP